MHVRRALPRARRVRLAALVLGVAGATTVTWQASTALYSATTSSNAGFGTGSVVLADDDTGAALLALGALRPGSTGQSCVRLTYSGTLDAAVRLYVTGLATTNTLSTYLNVQVEEGTGATSYPSCTGFAPLTPGNPSYNGTLAAMPTTYGTGLGPWAATPGGQRDYRVTWTLVSTAPTSTQSGTASATLTWEAQNT